MSQKETALVSGTHRFSRFQKEAAFVSERDCHCLGETLSLLQKEIASVLEIASLCRKKSSLRGRLRASQGQAAFLRFKMKLSSSYNEIAFVSGRHGLCLRRRLPLLQSPILCSRKKWVRSQKEMRLPRGQIAFLCSRKKWSLSQWKTAFASG